jgi:glycosyltransferase involved in cell wall biosynthesis
MNIGFFIQYSPNTGGAFQYEQRFVQELVQQKSTFFNSYFYTNNILILDYYKDIDVKIKHIKYKKINSIKTNILKKHSFLYGIAKRLSFHNNAIEKVLLTNTIDLLWFVSPTAISLDFTNISFVTTVWDLAHRDTPEFPEVRNDWQFEKREQLYQNVLNKSVAVICESELGKKNIIKRYLTDEKRVEVINFLTRYDNYLSQNHIDIKKKYKLNGDYIYYPASFTAHKNHIYILEALSILKNEQKLILNAIFSGSDHGSLSYVKSKIKEYELEGQIHIIGFEKDEVIPHLYKQSLALVMPTYFGPTNLPPLEALSYGVPVCYSDLREIDQAIYSSVFKIDLNNPISLVNQLNTIREDNKIVLEKVNSGKLFLKNNGSNIIEKIESIVNKFQNIKNNWR